MPIIAEFTLTVSEEGFEIDTQISFDVVIKKKDGSNFVTRLGPYIFKAGQTFLTIPIEIASLNPILIRHDQPADRSMDSA